MTDFTLAITPEQFRAFADQGYNRIPVTSREPADLETPVSIWMKLANAPGAFLFESVEGGERLGRYSIIGLPVDTWLRARGSHLEVLQAGEVVEEYNGDPLDFIDQRLAQWNAPPLPGMPDVSGGLAGYFGYDCVQYIEPRLAGNALVDPLGLPDILLFETDTLAVFDNLKGELILVVYQDPAEPNALVRAQNRLADLRTCLVVPVHEHERGFLVPQAQRILEDAFHSGFTGSDFRAAVERVQEYIAAGDCMQVVLSNRLSMPFTSSPLAFYRALRRINPSPYMYLLHCGDHQVIGSSPEILVRRRGQEVCLRPIAGTRRRGRTPEEDLTMEREMLADPKEIAEHLMLVDLGRNDVGRMAQTGTVELTERMVVERFSHVMHITSNIVGQVRDGISPMGVLRAAFPAGTLSGAPKVRAMEIIAELEPVKRSVYGGAVGLLGYGGDLNLAIAIRTALVRDGMLYIQAGAGIVQDSVPRLEWKECMNKARALFKAAEMVQEHLEN